MYKNLLILILNFFCITGLVQGQQSWTEGKVEAKVYINDLKESESLRNLGLKGEIYTRSGYALLYLSPGELEQLTNAGFRYEILKDDLQEFAGNFWSDRDAYHSYDEIIWVIDSLSTLYPSFCKKYSYGLSVEGRQLCALKISDNVNTDEPEPEIMFDGGIHGDEAGGPENLVRFAKFLCNSYNADPQITSMVNTREIWLYIMVNPDGRVNMLRYNSNGVDLNRDWGYMWNGEGSSPDYYSQVETRALRECMLSNQFVVHTTYHSGTVFLAYVWSYRPDTCPDHAHIHHLAEIYADSSGYVDLTVEQGYNGMYPIRGSSKDAAYGSMGSVAWTMEISTDKQPPPSQIQYFYNLNEPAMIAMIEQAGYGISGTVAEAGTGYPVAASIFVDDSYPCYSDPVIGDFHKYLLPGTYSVTAMANGYEPMTQLVTVNENENTLINFNLQPEYSHFARRVIACRIPTSNFDDEAKTYATLGEPDGIHYSLSWSGWIILDMQNDILNGPANEITIHEGDSDPEGYACYAAAEMDGPWQLVGNGTGTATFDLGASGLTTARYIRIEDDGDGPVTGDNAGFDLDAVEIPEQPQVIYLMIDCEIDDSQGNNDHRIDPGENFNLVVTMRNVGTMMLQGGQSFLNIDQQYISVSNPEQDIEDLDFGDVTQLEFQMNCSFFCPPEELLMMVLNINANEGTFMESYPVNFSAGAIIEDWEAANFLQFDWSTGGNKPWAMSFLAPFEGIVSAKSGNIDDSESSWLQVAMDVIGYDDISFYRKVSSEVSDHLKFYIDNNLVDEWSGEAGWEEEYYEVTPGFHTFKWIYQKDNLNTAGSDGGWIDYIVFPSCNLDGTLKTLANALPHEFCGGGSSQLGAYVLGGTGDYEYLWEPSYPLDDSTSQFPVATFETGTDFSVEVNDGEDTVSSTVTVNSFPVPVTPAIQQTGDSLVSSAMAGNQWYNPAGPIPGATGKVYYPQVETEYFVIMTGENGCISDSSNIISFIFTGIKEEPAFSIIHAFPNPFKEIITVEFKQVPRNPFKIRLYDVLGRNVLAEDMIGSDLQQVNHISTTTLKNSLYLLIISDMEGNVLFSSKLIKY